MSTISLQPEPQPTAPAPPSSSTAVIAELVILRYSSNIGVLLTSYGFRFPIFLTICHVAECAALSYVAVAVAGFCASVVGGNVSLRYLAVSFNQAVSY